jgi:leucyl/phenylalanyl-tRNA---protein transferase
MDVPFLLPDQPFPDLPAIAWQPEGLVAIGADLRPARLLAAYRRGIFPWYSEGDPILWWCPNPRMVLATTQFKLRKSLAKRIRALARQGDMHITLDQDFSGVIAQCAASRVHSNGTWIVPEIMQAYTDLHHTGHAHSVEVRQGGALVGGLYGVCIGRMFYGESMFSLHSDMSKTALAALVHICQAEHMPWIDCQQETAHLAFMGAQPIARTQFLQGVTRLTALPPVHWAVWQTRDLLQEIAYAANTPATGAI